MFNTPLLAQVFLKNDLEPSFIERIVNESLVEFDDGELFLEHTESEKILLDDRLEYINIKLLNDNMIQLCYNYKDYYIENFHNTNILIALFTTSSARLRLYKMLDKLGRAVVYFDTDSIFYIYDGSNKIKTGTMLGELTDELGENVHITDWASTGPKSYYYKTNDVKILY